MPREYWANLEFRKWLIESCRNNRENQQAVIEGCRKDILFFINSFCVQYNPLLSKIGQGVGPFITYDFQERAILKDRGILWCYEHNNTGVVEKSRDMGASWLFQILQVWLAGFNDHVQCLNISRSAPAVDSASQNSLFAKIRFLVKHCPRWLIGPVFEQRFNIKFDRTMSEIAGEASTGRSGAGSRAAIVFVDEFPQIKEDAEVRQNTASIAECRFFNGTHQGIGSEFYNLTKTAEFVQIQMHWSRHPRKNQTMYSWEGGRPKYWRYDDQTDEVVESKFPVSPFPEDYQFDRSGNPSGGPYPGLRSVWYDKKSQEIGTIRQVAMELDINPSGSSSQVYEALVIKALVAKSKDEYWRGQLHFDPDMATPTELVPGNGLEDMLQLWLHPGLDNKGNLCHVEPSDYIIGNDSGAGTGASPSCLSIFDSLKGVKVGTFTHSRIGPKDMAKLAVALCRLFRDHEGNPAYLIWEIPGPGLTFGETVLKELGFTNIHWRVVNFFGQEERRSDTPGFHANTTSKDALHREYQFALKTKSFVNWDKVSLLETLGYVYSPAGNVEHPAARRKNTDGSAAGTNHGDHVVADALTWHVAKKRIVVERPEVEVIEPSVLTIAGRRLYRERNNRSAMSKWV